MRASIVESMHELRAMRAEWDALIARAPNGDLFGTFDWIEPWWVHFSTKGEAPAIITVREGDRLVGALPLVRSAGSFPRTLRSPFNFYSGRTDLYADPEHPHATRAILDHLTVLADSWDVVRLDWVSEASPFYLHLAHADLGGLAVHATKTSASPYLNLTHWDSFTAYYQRRFSSETRRRDRNSLKEAAEKPGFRLETITDRHHLRDALETAMGVEILGWKGGERSSMKQDPRVHSFVHEVSERLALRGCTALTLMHVNGRPVAFVLGFLHRDTYFYYKTSFDPAYTEIRPGRIVTNRALEEAFSHKLSRFDFLGADDDYKLRFTESTRAHATIFLYHSGARSRALRTMKRTAVPLAKDVLQRGGRWPILIDRPGRLA
jgi:CelD/BcsL family acetyltransferase involved in cellulose biosynthesis